MPEIDFALVLNLHQPTGNLEQLLDTDEWQAREILWALDRIPRWWEYEDIGRVHVARHCQVEQSDQDLRRCILVNPQVICDE
jgi:hypothetical protein